MRVLVAIDSSGASQYVIAEAASRPWPSDTVFCVQSIIDGWDWRIPDFVREVMKQATLLVEPAADELRQSGHEVVAELQAGVPKRAIPEYAEKWRADLIMVGSHRSTALSRFLLGSVAQAVLRSAPCSVEIVRPSPRGRPAYTSGMKILVGADGSNCSVKATCAVAHRPWPTGTLVKVISAREPVTFPQDGMTVSLDPLYPADLMEELEKNDRRRAEDALIGARHALTSAGLTLCDSSVTLFGDPRTILLDEAKAWDADLVVLGSHGRHGFDRVLLGSVSESVAMHAHCSVEVIRGTGQC